MSILIGRLQVCLIASPQNAVNSLQPAREATTRDLGIDIRTGTSQQVNTSLLGRIEEGLQVKDALGRVVARIAFQQSPIDVERHAIESQGLDLLEDINVQGGDRQTEQFLLDKSVQSRLYNIPIRVDFTTENHQPLAVDEYRVLVPGHL